MINPTGYKINPFQNSFIVGKTEDSACSEKCLF